MKSLLQDKVQELPLLCDGAMGTQLMLAGLEQGTCGEEWNITHPDRVLAIQRRYAQAGAECIITNTFGGSRITLSRHSKGDRAAEFNKAGVEIARQSFDGREGYVLGDIGPFGGLLTPLGDITEAAAQNAFEEQAAALVEAGADAIIIETQASLEELLIGINAAKAAGAKCIIGSMAYDVSADGSKFRTMMGVGPEKAAEFIAKHGAHIVALNCGTGMDMQRALKAVERYKSVTSLPVMVQPNAGKPRLVNMKVVYDETPQQMANGLTPLLEAGANIVGTCCGSTPEHTRALREIMDRFVKSKGI